MVESASVNGLPQRTLEERFSALEAKFIALEKRHNEPQGKSFALTENSTGKGAGFATAQVCSNTSNSKILETAAGLSLAASFRKRNYR